MSASDYSRAHKLAQKTFRQDVSAGKFPYLQVLDELLTFSETAGEQDLGLIEIPIDRIAGTKTAGRTRAFSSDFMPLLEGGTEFATKWSALYDSHIEEGIREPVIACEFMNSYYIIEGNKRVSVLKYSGAVNVLGYVTRYLPVQNGTREVRVYYEFTEFFRSTGINTVYFTKPGSFHDLCRLVGKEFGAPWSDDDRMLFTSSFLYFTQAYNDRGGARLPITAGDAFLVYLNVYGYAGLADKSRETIRKELVPLWNDLEALSEETKVNVVLQPEKEPEPSVIDRLVRAVPQAAGSAVEASPIRRLVPSSVLTVGFIYYKTAETSSWTYSHDLGRLYLEENLKGRVKIRVYDGVMTDEECLTAIETAIADGCTVIFTTSPRFLGPSIKAGMKQPQIYLLNCSLNSYSGHLRTYYGRLYEAKFLVGMLAGILTDTDRIGYVADFPVFGTPASINAFALGVKMVNPSARVHLAWTSMKDFDRADMFGDVPVSHICGSDSIAPKNESRLYGLYDARDKKGAVLAASIWHWGKFYQRILLTILNGGWNRTTFLPAGRKPGMGGSINYWWGISSGMIDMIVSKTVPERTRTLIELVRRQIENGEFRIFSGDLIDQEGTLRDSGSGVLTPEEIIRMDWLAQNVIGHIPAEDELAEAAIPMVRIQGIYSDRDGLF